VEDRESGSIVPGAGASGLPLVGVSGSARQAPGPVPGFRDGASGDRHPRPKGKKRRKGRRGRKVFARDQIGSTVQAPPPSDAPAMLQPPPVAAIAERPPAAPPNGMQVRVADGSLPVFAALDLGTNNCRLLVAVPGRPGQFRVIDAFSRIVRLGEGLTATGRLGDAAMDRAIEALKICAAKLGCRPIRRARLIATEACRAAENGADFLSRVEAEAGLSLEVIDRHTEARLAVSGCGSLVERGTEGVVLFDIGGGSSEIVLIDVQRQRSARLANHIVEWTSLPVGVVSLAERFGGRDVTRQSFQAMIDHVAGLLAGFPGRRRLDHLVRGGKFHLLGTSGTVTTLAGVHLGLDRYERRRVDGLWMDKASVDRMVEKLLSWSFEERVGNACIGADRADLVLAGCAILEAIRAVWPSERLRVADRGLREGMLSELMGEEGVWRKSRRFGP
jgi:exopolyphosphatase/guanosine-5'-triphosphate,3'-diphosphate pyrophosphatase